MEQRNIGNVSLLAEVDCLCLDGTREGLRQALAMRKTKQTVLIAIPQTYLPVDLPALYHKRGGAVHVYPDIIKGRMEELCDKNDIQILYGIYEIEEVKQGRKTLVLVAAKGGSFGILCDKVWRTKEKPGSKKYCAAYIQDGERIRMLSRFYRAAGTKTAAEQIKAQIELLLEDFGEEKKSQKEIKLGRFLDPEHCYFNQVRAGQKSELHCDVLVVGGGTAGALSALYAARQGVRTVLIEGQLMLGGSSTIGGVNSYWFGNRFHDVAEIDREVDQIYRRLGIKREEGIWQRHDHFHGGIKGYVLLKLCLEAGVRIVLGQTAYDVEKEGNRVTAVKTAGAEGRMKIYSSLTLDTTGDGDLAFFAGADFVYGSQRDAITYWASLAQYPDVEHYQNNFSSMVICADPWDMTRFIRLGRKRGVSVFDHGVYVSMRESRHIKGRSEVSLKDILCFRQYEDALYSCFSNYDPKGKLSADLLYCGWSVPQLQMQVPLSALLPVDRNGVQVCGLYVGGKAIAATHNAFPSLRMQPDLMHQGAVLGLLAGKAVQQGCLIEEIAAGQRRKWINEHTKDPLSLPAGYEKDRRIYVNALNGKERDHWIDVDFQYCETKLNPKLALLTAAGGQVLPLLYQRSRQVKENHELWQVLQCLILWHGGAVDIDSMITEMNRQLRNGLPKRRGSTMCVQLLPDHGVMPELVYQMNLLGFSRQAFSMEPFRKVLHYLTKRERDYHSIEQGIYHYIECFAYVAERTGEKAFLPLLKTLQEFPEFSQALGEEARTGLMRERLLILWFRLNGARARLGERAGYEALIRLCGCDSQAIARSAGMCLKELAHEAAAANQDEWKKWLSMQITLPLRLVKGKEW